MGVYIKGARMPTSCYVCNLKRRNGMDFVCLITHERFSIADVNILEYRLDNCPLVPVPCTAETPSNGDRLRAMSDEELATWLCDVAGWLPTFEGRVHPILEWLRQEAQP